MAGADAAWLEAIRSSVASGVEAAARAAPTVAGGLDPWLVGAWAVASALLGAGLVGGLRSLYVRATLWPRVRLLGHDVLLSDDFGPALLGVVRPTIVLPRSLLGLDRGALRIACRHELEHRRAADPLLFLASAALLVATPWNVALWWLAARLRLAAELDCDRRVLRAGVPKDAYGTLLLRLGAENAPGTLSAVPALARPTSILERRLRMMTHGVRNGGMLGTLLALGVIVVLGVAACESDAPTVTATPEPEASVEPVEAPEVSVAPDQKVVIRGFSSIELGNQPLIYIDGVRVESTVDDPATGRRSVLDELSPDDIESIEVIKGGAATRLYGEAAAAGVIQIKTKGGAAAEAS
jgi:TonB-dependent SusC/RagA subfamily outer membrane receptor